MMDIPINAAGVYHKDGKLIRASTTETVLNDRCAGKACLILKIGAIIMPTLQTKNTKITRESHPSWASPVGK